MDDKELLLKKYLVLTLILSNTIKSTSDAPWTTLRKTGIPITYEWIKEGSLLAERELCKTVFKDAYKNFSLDADLQVTEYTNLDAWLEDSFNGSFKTETIQLNNPQSKSYFIHAIINNSVIGFACFEEDGNAKVYLRKLAVDPAYKRLGIGTELVKSIFNKLPNIKEIRLITRKINLVARDFFQALGFVENDYIRAGYDSALFIGYALKIVSP